ncbi:hypothetical protein L6R52_07345, partial [Myxococcota bacterium]|nr:hypothetical protein [Myxococcota bacterium]
MDASKLEQQALELLKRGDLPGAHQTLTALLQLRPNDQGLRARIKQVESILQQRAESQARIQAEPLRYAHAYIQAGRLAEGLQLLRGALAKDPSNQRLRELALEVARRLQAQVQAQQQKTPGDVQAPRPSGPQAPLLGSQPGSLAAQSPSGSGFLGSQTGSMAAQSSSGSSFLKSQTGSLAAQAPGFAGAPSGSGFAGSQTGSMAAQQPGFSGSQTGSMAAQAPGFAGPPPSPGQPGAFGAPLTAPALPQAAYARPGP